MQFAIICYGIAVVLAFIFIVCYSIYTKKQYKKQYKKNISNQLTLPIQGGCKYFKIINRI
jgi:prolipoprotein diacylglyceryltransferase